MKKNKNGLPLDIKYCIKCNLSNQQPTTVNEYFHINETVQNTVEFDDYFVILPSTPLWDMEKFKK